MWRRVANVAWWLGLAAYFGGIVTIATIAPVVFHTTRDTGITMPGIVSPPLDVGTHAGGQAAGEIFGAILNRFAWVEVVALGLMLAGLAGFLLAHTPVRRSVWVLMILWMLLALVLGYDAGVLRPAVVVKRAEVRTSAALHAHDPQGTPWPERDEFDRLHQRSESYAHVKAYLLLGMLLVTAWRGLADGSGRNRMSLGEHMRKDG